jgi:hypothetical protein
MITNLFDNMVMIFFEDNTTFNTSTIVIKVPFA